MDINQRVKTLVEGARYDVSCSSSGSGRAAEMGSMGSAALGGICHSFTSDGRCVSLLKILLSNRCEYDCLYCHNRRSNDIPRASLAPRELAELVYNFYRRNYIEGLFLSSAVDTSPNHTMQGMIEAVSLLRGEYRFNGYIHMKAIPRADPSLIEHAASLVDRMSINIELPSETSLKLLAPQKKKEAIISPLKQLAQIVRSDESRVALPAGGGFRQAPARRSIPAGQTTQMIIGATADSDGQIIRLSEALYRHYGLKRVYYSAYTPVGDSSLLPTTAPPLKRENRLYQADWLLRYYGFDADELAGEGQNLSLDLDPKCDWAIRNLGRFPVEINRASYEELLRVPGIGVTNAWRIAKARATAKLELKDLKRMRVVLKRALNFITIDGRYYGLGITDRLKQAMIREQNPSVQLTFDEMARLNGKSQNLIQAGNWKLTDTPQLSGSNFPQLERGEGKLPLNEKPSIPALPAKAQVNPALLSPLPDEDFTTLVLGEL